jgi:hypothetical protein
MVELLAHVIDEPLRVQRFAELGVVLDPPPLVVLGQVVVWVTPPLGPHHLDLLAPQLLPQRLENPHSYTLRKIRWRRLLSARYSSSTGSGAMIPSTGTLSPSA